MDIRHKGKNLTISLLIIVLILSFSTVVLRIANVGDASGITRATIRFTLTLGLCSLVYQGFSWARITMAMLLLLGGVLGILSSLVMLNPNSVIGIGIMLFGTTYIVIALMLLISQDIKDFLASRRTSSVS